MASNSVGATVQGVATMLQSLQQALVEAAVFNETDPNATPTHNAQIAPTTPATLSFFSLPLEVRTMIYKDYFDSLYITIKNSTHGTYDGAVSGIPQPGRAWYEHNVAIIQKDVQSFLMSNKTIAAEARPHLYAMTTFVFQDMSSFILHSRAMQVPGLPLRLRTATGELSNAIEPIERLWLDLTEPRERPWSVMTEQFLQAATVQHFELPLLHSLTQSLPALKHLDITIKPQCNFFVKGWPINPMRKTPLRAFCQLQNLDSFTIALGASPLMISAPIAYGLMKVIVNRLSHVLAKHVLKNASDDLATDRLNHDGCPPRVLQLRVVNRMLEGWGREGPRAAITNLAAWSMSLQDDLIDLMG